MKYIYLNNNVVQEIIPEINPNFPEYSIDERYSAQFLLSCVTITDDSEIQTGYIYDSETNTFSPPPEPEIEEEEEIKEIEVEE